MNKESWDAFWEAMPPEMKLLLGVVAGATVHFLRNRAVPIREGLASALIAIIAGYIITFGVCYVRHWDMGEWWFAGSGLAFMANFFLGGMETVGKQFQTTPIKVIIETLLDAYDTIKARLKPKE
ncbi:hypothetical protein [Spirosoma foliorum]|uniref:Holin n=1 Tax=Spirosoma foliorum TaxID=2710596 RepID=A0A7G5H5F3_9BACT|nr:hypothetical protein [Spirosoma foliorum]QMW06345.1 hypothetical protein H3H32_16375 [Spirosoma foliorum]